MPKKPTNTWTCDCGAPVARYRGEADVSCPRCDQPFNAMGQRLRRGREKNLSNRDESIGDIQGMEMLFE